MLCTWATILYRIDVTVAKLDSNHQAHQTKSLQRTEEDNIVAKTHRCSMTPHYSYKSVHRCKTGH
jgi:hypothetical protein